MSGLISGFIDLNNTKASLDQGNKMVERMKLYKLDKIDCLSKMNVFMACGLLDVDNNYNKEVLPCYYEKMDIIITADAVVYNKDELKEKLNLKKNIYEMTDSEIIVEAYMKWKEDCPKYIVGDFTFAIWNFKEETLFCARDHTGNRTLYYRYDEGIFSYSTIMETIKSIYTNNELNEEWIADYLALPSVIHELNAETTVNKKVMQVPPGCILIFNKDGLRIKKYWEPLKEIHPLNLKSDSEYEEAFKKVFFEAVKCRLGTNKNIGISLSGGLDSGSVACIAAEMLKNDNKNLKGYTSIPIKEFKNNDETKYHITDESNYVKVLTNKYNNIDVTFCRCEGKNSITDINKFIEIFEQPYKIFRNIYWINGIQEKAYNDGCKVLLGGQFGNSTISYGNIETHLKTLMSQGKIYDIYKEIIGISNVQGISKKLAIKNALEVLLPAKIMKLIRGKKLQSEEGVDIENLFLNKEVANKWNVIEKVMNKYYYLFDRKYYTLDEMHEFILNECNLSHIGMIETKLSLFNGIVLRDPSRDKRLIEFCLSLPSDQFVRNGVQRRLIRCYMKDILPDKIRLNVNRRGYQSADWIDRLKEDKEKIINELLKYSYEQTSNYYLDFNLLKKSLLQDCDDIEQNKRLNRYIPIYILLKFLNKKMEYNGNYVI